DMAARYYTNGIFDTKRAVAGFTRVTKSHPNSPYAWKRLGDSKGSGGDLEGAADGNSMALKIDPHFKTALQDLAGIYEHMGKYNDAVRVYTLAIQEGMPLIERRAGCYEKLGEHDKAIADYRTGIINLNRTIAKSLNYKLPKPDALIPQVVNQKGYT